MKQEHIHLPLYLSVADDCSYLPGRKSRSLFVDPDTQLDMRLYGRLMQKGFRRSGRMVYRPHCDDCRQCLSVRIPVERFDSRRRFRRLLRTNGDLHLVSRNASFVQAHYELYRDYIDARHAEGSMADPSPRDYADFLIADWADTLFLEIRRQDRLMAVAVTDQVDDGLSAVYTFFDPAESRRSLGTYSVLAQINLCRQLALPYLYLGYWIRDCGKMRYKADFRPVQVFSEGRWQEFSSGKVIEVPELPQEPTKTSAP